MDERLLAERLISYDTSAEEGIRRAADFVRGWLEARDVPVRQLEHGGLPVLLADVGPANGPRVVLHGHIDVVPANAEQFTPRVEGDRLFGRGAYDMKGALGAIMCAVRDAAAQDRVAVRFMCVPDEEAEDVQVRSTDALVAAGVHGDFAITGEPTDLLIGVQAKGVLAVRLELSGTAAHGSTPWLGDNAILKAHDAFRRIETLPFSRESSELFDRPSINLATIAGGDVFNKVPDRCVMVVDIRYLPEQDPHTILDQIRAIGGLRVLRSFIREPAIVSRRNPYVLALREALGRTIDGEALSIGRDGASDAVSFLAAGIPAVEFGPVGAGHHGPEEWVSLRSLSRFRATLVDFVTTLPERLERTAMASATDLRAVEGGLA